MVLEFFESCLVGDVSRISRTLNVQNTTVGISQCAGVIYNQMVCMPNIAPREYRK